MGAEGVGAGRGAQLLWRYSREAVQMRLRYLQTEQGAEVYTVLVQDIPGVQYGTPMHRLDQTLLRVLPGSLKDPVKHAVGRTVQLGEKGISATAGKLANTLISTRRALLPPTIDTLATGPRGLQTTTCLWPQASAAQHIPAALRITCRLPACGRPASHKIARRFCKTLCNSSAVL